MAERYSTAPNASLAFQERANAELTILNGRLHERLKRDLSREIYHENVLKHKEDAVIAQIRKVQQTNLRDFDPGSPESDVFLTPKASPSEIPLGYGQGQSDKSCDFRKSDGSYRKGNALYYSLVHVEDELYGNANEKCSVLEKELAEQDELFKSFQSIIIREGKSKVKKPVSLNLSAGKRTKSKIAVEDKPVNASKFPNTRLCKLAASRENSKEVKVNSYTRFSYNKCPRPTKKINRSCSPSNVENAAWLVLDEMTTKKGTSVADRNGDEVMSNPEGDGTGPDSCLDAGSSGYITGGGSPKDTTGSEGFGVDTTEAASSEDIPHDNERFPVSSSASSDAGTWDSTFHGNDEQTFIDNGNKSKNNNNSGERSKSESLSEVGEKNLSREPDGAAQAPVSLAHSSTIEENDCSNNRNSTIFAHQLESCRIESEVIALNAPEENIGCEDLNNEHDSCSHVHKDLPIPRHDNSHHSPEFRSDTENTFELFEFSAHTEMQNLPNPIGDVVINLPRTNCFIDAASLSDENEVNTLPPCGNKFNGTKSEEVKDIGEACKLGESFTFKEKEAISEKQDIEYTLPEEEEGIKPNLIRRNTFELEADDDKLALLRQEYEKRQGSTLFQSSSSEGSLGNSTEVNRVVSNTLAKAEHPDTLIIEDKAAGTYNPDTAVDNDVQSPDSLNNDIHVKEYLENTREEENITVSNDSNMNPESTLCSLDRDQVLSKSSHQMPLDNFNKFESLPIVSGGSVLSDVSSDYNHSSVSSSPLVLRRKNESAPIVSGGIDIVDMVPETQTKCAQPKSLSPLTRSWIVDMSDSGRSSSSIRPQSRSSVERNRSSSSGLGFFVPLDDPPSSLENVSTSSNSKKDSNVSEVNSSCGFFVELKSDSTSREMSKSSEDQPQSEKKLFSMFIDIGDSCNNTDSASPKSKNSSPFLAGKKFRPRNHADRFTLKNEKNMSTSSDSSMEINEHPEVSKGKLLFSDESLHNSSQAISDSSLQDVSSKKQSFFMFIEANSSPTPKKRNLPSGLRPSSQRHSWNVDYKKSEVQSLPTASRREHKRAYSLSVDNSNFADTNREDRFQSGPASIEETGLRHRENNHKPMMSSWHGSVKPSTELSRIINGAKQEHKENKSIENGDKIEELSCSIKSDEVYDTSNATNVSSKDDPNRTFVLDEVSKVVNANTNDLEVSTPSHDVVSDLSKDETEKGSSTCSNATDKSEGSGEVVTGVNEDTPKASTSQQTLADKGNSSGFVKLSDMDKEPSKVWDTSATIEKKTSRMSRSIPEGCWLEERMSTQSATRRSLSRLFPHLYPRRTPEPEESPQPPDVQSSAPSSLQSSCDPSGLECSTEGTEGLSVEGGPCSRLGEDLLRMFLEEISPDVTVEVGGRRIKAHKCILSSRCQYFAGILSGGWVESAGNVISLQGFSYNTVHFALCHIYSGASNIPDTINIVELATLADMLCLEGLKEVIAYTLKVKHCHFFHKPCSTCTIGVLECLPLAAAYGLDEIYNKSLRWITRHFVRIWPTKEFANLPKELQDKCYKQHVIHMCPENVLDMVMRCNKLEATIPNVRWAQSVFSLNSKLHDAAVKYLIQHFNAVISSEMFLSVGKEDAWTVGRIEGTLISSAQTLSAEQACLSYGKIKNLLNTISSSSLTPELKPEFLDLLCQLDSTVEDCLVRQVGRAARTSAWTLLDVQLRRKIQDMACVAFLPGDEKRRSRHSTLGKHGESSRSQTGDLGGPKSKGTDSVRKEAPTPQTKPQTPPSVMSQPARSKKLSQVKSRYLEPKPVRKEIPSSAENNKKLTSTFGQRRITPGKQLISSSDSSRTSSPATTRALAPRPRPRTTKEFDRMTMSTDSLCEGGKPIKSMSTKSVPENRSQHTPVPGRKSMPTAKAEPPYKVKSAESIQEKQGSKRKTIGSRMAKESEGSPSGSEEQPYKAKSAESIPDRNGSAVPPSKCKALAYSSSKKSEGSQIVARTQRSAVPSISSARKSSQNATGRQPGDTLIRNSTFRVSQKPSSPSKTIPVSSREPFGRVSSRGGNVNQKIVSKPPLNNNNALIMNGKATTAGIPASATKSKTSTISLRSTTFLKEEPTVGLKKRVE